MRLGVVVLSYEGAELTLACLESLAAASYRDRVDIVVDNGSTDDVLCRVQERFPNAERVRLDRNLGFSAGNNAGIRRALEFGCDLVLVLNNDTIVPPDALEVLANSASAHPEAGAVAPLIVFAEDPDLIWFAGARFSPRAGLPGRMSHYRDRLSRVALAAGPIERFTGAAVLVPRAVLERCGMLDDELFFLYEDVEWSLRIRAAGYTVHFEPAARILHRVAVTQGGEYSDASFYYGLRNQLTISDRLHPLGQPARSLRAAVALGTYVVRTRHAVRSMSALRATAAGLADWQRGVTGQWNRQ